jgi:hypothetical protein
LKKKVGILKILSYNISGERISDTLEGPMDVNQFARMRKINRAMGILSEKPDRTHRQLQQLMQGHLPGMGQPVVIDL